MTLPTSLSRWNRKRKGRRIAFLKFRILRLKQLESPEPTQESLFPDIEDLPAIANMLIQAGVVTTRGTENHESRLEKVWLRIVTQRRLS